MLERLQKLGRLLYIRYNCIKELPERQARLLLMPENPNQQAAPLKTLNSQVHCINLLVGKLIVVRASPAT